MAVEGANKNNTNKVNIELITYRLDEIQSSVKILVEKADQYVSVSDYNKLEAEFKAFKKNVEDNYVKKSDGKVIRNIGIAVVTSVAITVATLIVTYITQGGLSSGSK